MNLDKLIRNRYFSTLQQIKNVSLGTCEGVNNTALKTNYAIISFLIDFFFPIDLLSNLKL